MNKIACLAFLPFLVGSAAFAAKPGGTTSPDASGPSSKAAAAVADINLIYNHSDGDSPWTTVLGTSIKTSAQKDLFMQINMECALETETTVSNSNNLLDPEAFTTDTSRAEARVEIRVLIDGVAGETAVSESITVGRVAAPGDVTYCYRKQEQEAKFGGIMYNCDADGDGTATLSECSVADETLRLLQETMTANSFGFILSELGTGTHDIQVQARLQTDTYDENNPDASNEADIPAKSSAALGLGSMTVEEVRLVKDQNFEF